MQREEHEIAMAGDVGVGKSAIIVRTIYIDTHILTIRIGVASIRL
jgi:GTPase SAR1 family protein